MDPKEAQGLVRRGAARPVGDRARARRGRSDWLYTYLRTLLSRPDAPTGWNNVVFPNVAMPHVLWKLQGEQVLKRAHR